MNKSEKILKYSIGVLFLLLYMLVATISAICSIDFFKLSHSHAMSICLAVAFELGAMCSLCAGVFMKSNRTLSFGLFTLLTLFQMMGNVFHSYTNLASGFIEWINLFGLDELETIAQKRIVAAVSGAILPIVALGFIKCFVDYNDKTESRLEDEITVTEETNKQLNETKNGDLTDEIKTEEKTIIKKEETPYSANSNTKVDKPEQKPKQDIKTDSNKYEEAQHTHKFVNLDPSTMI